MVGGLAFAKARELVSRLLGRSHPGVSYKNGTHSGKTGRKAVSEHAKLSEVGTGRPQAVITIILFLYLLSDQEIISFTRSFGQMVEKAHSQEVA